MLTEIDLSLYRCPIDPKREARIVLEDDLHLFCERCRVQFRSKDGIPSFVVVDAVLPSGCEKIKELPCRRLGDEESRPS
jgi:uncharacterized protein YbaR (Trm112 family)